MPWIRFFKVPAPCFLVPSPHAAPFPFNARENRRGGRRSAFERRRLANSREGRAEVDGGHEAGFEDRLLKSGKPALIVVP
jgi:hypothetical protein